METVKPIIKLQPGVCKICKTPLNIILSDMVNVTLNENGMPMSSDVVRSSIKGICSRCLTEQPMIRRGLYYVPDTPFGRAMVCEDGPNIPVLKTLRGVFKLNPFSK